jgi:hypothetical protein
MMRNYLTFLSLMILVMIAMFYMVGRHTGPFEPTFTWWLLPVLFLAISATGHYLMTQSIKAQPKQFMNRFMLATSVKFFLYLTILLIWYFLQDRSLSNTFITIFALLYLSVTALDLISILKLNKKHS